jgi:hypothetical protein
MTLGTLRKNVENQTGTINHPHLEMALEITLLSWRKCVIKDDQFEVKVGDGITNFVSLA